MKMKFPQIILIVVISCVTALVVGRYMFPHQVDATQTAKESAYDRVLRTGTIRCGYGVWEPALSKDPNTGKLSGIFHDYLEAVGRAAQLKIEWTQEVGLGDFPTALNSGKIDGMCAGMWPKAFAAKEVLFTEPTYYLPINAYVRLDDKRFDGDLSKINFPNIKISVMDSELSAQLANMYFPKAQTLSLTQLQDASILLVNVATNKADVTFTDAWTGSAYMKANPGKVRIVPVDKPLRLYGHTIALGKNEFALQNLLNTTTEELLGTGELEGIVHKYAIPGVLLMKKVEYQ
jgi:ABC-type amino acid transport substrate-binding protein